MKEKKQARRMIYAVLTPCMLAVSLVVSMPSAAGAAFTGQDGRELLTVETEAGSGAQGWKDGAADLADLGRVGSVLILRDGGLLFSDLDNHSIRLLKNGEVTTLAGLAYPWTKGAGGRPEGAFLDGAGRLALFHSPAGLAAAADGTVYVADSGNHAIRRISPDGLVTTAAGHGLPGSKDAKGPLASFNAPQDVAAAADGSIYVADTRNHLIRRIAPDGNVTTLNAAPSRSVTVGGGTLPAGGYRDGPLAGALFNEPAGLALDSKGNLYVSDSGNGLIRYIDFGSGTVNTVAGTFSPGAYEETGLYAQGAYADGPAFSARFNRPAGLTWSETEGLLIADSGNHVIRRLAGKQVTTVAGSSEGLSGSTDGTEKSALFNAPADVVYSAANDKIWIADAGSRLVRSLRPFALPAGVPSPGSLSLVIDGRALSGSSAPVLLSGKLMVPLRQAADELGYRVAAGVNGEISLTRGDRSIFLKPGSSSYRIQEGQEMKTLSAEDVPVLLGGRLYVPVRTFGSLVDADVEWLQEAKTAVIRSK